jgi:hypothetical protein
MRPTIAWRKLISGTAVTAFAAALAGGAAQYGPSGGALQGPLSPRQGPIVQGPESDPTWNAKRLNAMNSDRQKSMVSDAEKLLKLARQLDAEIASNSGDEMTPDEARKVAEIEKLAHNVKSKMAMSFTGAPDLRGGTELTPGLDGPRPQ